MNKRIIWIDAAKGIGMFLVIFNHFNIDFGQENIKIIIASFHMPLFFLLSGLTIKSDILTNNEYCRYVKKRFLGIMIPFFLWALMFSNGITWNNMIKIGWGSNKTLIAAGSNAVLWFLPCLFFSSLFVTIMLSFVSKMKMRENYNIFVLITLAVINFILGGLLSLVLPSLEKMDFPYSLNIVFTANGFMLVGVMLKNIMQKRDCLLHVKNIRTELCISAIAFVLVIVLAFSNKQALANDWGRVVMARSQFGNYYLFIGSGICGSVFIVLLVRVILKYENIITRIGTQTLIILPVHSPLAALIENDILSKVETNSMWMILILILFSGAVLVTSYCLSVFIRKLVPNLAGLH